MVENATGEKNVKRNGQRWQSKQQQRRERKGKKKEIQTRFSSRSLKNCNFSLVAHRASSKKGIKNEISASRATKKKTIYSL